MRPRAFELERFFSRREFAASFNLCASDCESTTVGALLALEDGAAEELAQLELGYTQPAGDPRLRRAIAALYETIDSEEIYVHAAGEEAIFTFMHAALDPGDHVIVHSPSYQSLAELPRALGCDVSLWEAEAQERWRLDLNQLRRLLRPTTRAIIVNCPHSPTGYQMGSGDWEQLIGLSREAGVTLLADEAYRGLEYAAEDRLPAVCDLYESGCSLGVLSKGYGLPGLRIGWLATRNHALLRRITAIKDYTTICASAPSELLGRIALRHGDVLLRRARKLVIENLGHASSFFSRHEDRFDWVPPLAGPVTFPTYLGEEGVDELCRDLLEKEGVLLLPGRVFRGPFVGAHGAAEFRLGLGRCNFEAGLARLDAYFGMAASPAAAGRATSPSQEDGGR